MVINMKKRALSLTLALILCLSLVGPALAAEKTIYLDGYNSANNPIHSKVQEADAGNSQLSLTGDLTQTGEVELRDFVGASETFACPVYTAKGAVEVVLTDGYTDGDVIDIFEYRAVTTAKIDTVTYDAAKKSAAVLKENALCFDGMISCKIDGAERTMSLKEFYGTPDIWDKMDENPYIYKGAKATLTEPGTYCISVHYEALEGVFASPMSSFPRRRMPSLIPPIPRILPTPRRRPSPPAAPPTPPPRR